ncbi:histidine phosphatase family protein [Candidatus Kaiserbacteria bacterium]|nr:histidine phosphatase family protein [Candidatus Kaiserbacteria bacterium]
MKTVYFVRHGEAEVNVSSTFGAEDTPLTDKGREQARSVAERCAKLPIDVIIASTMERAQETASIVSRRIELPTEAVELFEERHRPSVLYGKERDNVEANRIYLQWIDAFFTSGNRVEDGDNFLSLKERAGKALSYLQERPEANILVVTHGFFLRTILARIIFGETLSPQELYMVMRTFHISNTGITMATFDPAQESERPYPRGPWRVLTWNDQAHLG